MTGTIEPTTILKKDVCGRIQRTEQQRKELLEAFDRSGMTVSAFSQWAGVNFQTLASWIQKRRRQASSSLTTPTTQVNWVEAVVATEAASKPAALTLQLPGNARIEISGVEQLGLAVELLRRMAC